jgi:kinesin family protein 4/21/27
MDALKSGSQYRSTASTLMNMTSSRSHAVFTVTLTQTIVSSCGGGGGGESGGDGVAAEAPLADAVAVVNDDVGGGDTYSGPSAGASDGGGGKHTTTLISKLTFVDLAGSERLKRTGAEGQRMREGIQVWPAVLPT